MLRKRRHFIPQLALIQDLEIVDRASARPGFAAEFAARIRQIRPIRRHPRARAAIFAPFCLTPDG